MRRDVNCGHSPQRMIGGEGIFLDDIQACAANLAVFKSCSKSCCVDDAAARHIDEEGVFLHLSESFCVKHVIGLVSKRQSQYDEVAVFENIVNGIPVITDEFPLEEVVTIDRELIKSVNIHAKGMQSVSQHPSVVAHADDADLAAVEALPVLGALDAPLALFPDRVIGFSEYGADCNPQFHSARPEQGDYTEEYQCEYHEHILKCIEERPFLWATHVWNLFDFAADGRDEGGKNGQNQKGLVEFDHKTKKDAFYLYKAAWSKDPFVHICGRRFVDRTGDKTQIKVYSNQSEVKLIVDGAEVAKESGAKVFCFEIPLTGEHRIEAVSGSLTDEIRIRKVEKANPDYSFGDAGEVVNWFDKDEIDPAYFSIKDKFGDLMRHSGTAAVQEILQWMYNHEGGQKDHSAIEQYYEYLTDIKIGR